MLRILNRPPPPGSAIELARSRRRDTQSLLGHRSRAARRARPSAAISILRSRGKPHRIDQAEAQGAAPLRRLGGVYGGGDAAGQRAGAPRSRGVDYPRFGDFVAALAVPALTSSRPERSTRVPDTAVFAACLSAASTFLRSNFLLMRLFRFRPIGSRLRDYHKCTIHPLSVCGASQDIQGFG